MTETTHNTAHRASDEALWDRFVGGEDGALGLLEERYRRALFRYFLLSTGRQDLSARFAGTVWAVLAGYRRPFEGYSSFRVWLYAVATQNCIPPTHPETQGLEDLVRDFRRAEPDSRTGKAFYRIMDMARAVRQPFLLATVGGLTVPQIAKVCRFTEERTMRRLTTAHWHLAGSGLFGPGEERPPCPQGRQAAGLMVMDMLHGLADESARALRKHLSSCAACERRMATFRHIHVHVQAIANAELSEGVAQALEEGFQYALTSPPKVERPPADPRPERSGLQKAAIFAASLALLVGGMVALLAVFGGKAPRAVPVALVAHLDGTVELRGPGESRWREMTPAQFLQPGSQLRTGQDGWLKLGADGAEWWLSPMSAVALPDSRTCELMVGRLYARCDAAEGADVRLVGANGSVLCRQGAFTATASPKRLRVGCLAGSAVLEGEGGARTELAPGDSAMFFEQAVVQPVRRPGAAALGHHLKGFSTYDGRRLNARQLASVCVARGGAQLPDAVKVTALQVAARVRGPVALVELRATVRNDGPDAWDGRLDLTAALLPPALMAAAWPPGPLAPGAEGTCRAVAVCAMPRRDGLHALGLNPEAVTAGPIGRLEVDVQASADGGIRLFDCPTLGAAQKMPGTVAWSASRESFDPAVPIVLEFGFHEREGVDAVGWETPEGMLALLAWRPEAAKERWLMKDRRVLIAFDATADFGEGGRAHAHEVLESLVLALPPGCLTALIAHDGALRLDPDGIVRHRPARAESMLAGAWQLEADGDAPREDIVDVVRRVAAELGDEVLVLAVAGRDAADLPGPSAEGGPQVRLAVLQVGAARADAAYSRACAESGGVALELPSAVPGDVAAFDFLTNLDEAAVQGAAVHLTAGGEGVVLRGPGRFVTQPVLVLVRPGAGGQALDGRLQATVGGRVQERSFSLHIVPDLATDAPLGLDLWHAIRARPGD